MSYLRIDIIDRKDEILQWISEGRTKAFICQQLKCKGTTLNSYLTKMGIEYTGDQGFGNRGKESKKYKTAIEYANKDNGVKANILKEKMIKDGIKEYKCEMCGNTTWLNMPIPLELHHINANHYDNDFSNLQILCSNCHSLIHKKHLSTKKEKVANKQTKEIKEHTCKICGKEFIPSSNNQIYCSQECAHKAQRVIERPSREELKQLIRTIPFVKIGEKYDVSDNAIRKWCKAENLPFKKTDIRKYSDEEWNQV